MIIALIFVIIILLYYFCEKNVVEEFYEFVTPSSLTIPDMFKLSDESMEDIFDYDTRITTFKQIGLCK